jgi:hypothetical protein
LDPHGLLHIRKQKQKFVLFFIFLTLNIQYLRVPSNFFYSLNEVYQGNNIESLTQLFTTLSQIKNFTLEEKVSVTTGVGWMNGRCVGNIPAIQPAHGTGWPGLCLEVIMQLFSYTYAVAKVAMDIQDSPTGVRDTDFVTAFPAGINAAATYTLLIPFTFLRINGILFP